MILFVETRQGGDRWSFSHAFLEACCCLCITVLIVLSSTAIARGCRPEQVVYFSRQVVGVPAITKQVLSQRTSAYQNWVEAFARNQRIPLEWAESGVRKKDYLQLPLRRLKNRNQHGVYFILKSMEQGSTFRSSAPKYPTADPHYRILAPQRSRFTHYYFYHRDPVLGPMVMRVAR